jgi:hypothetical protein
MDNLNNLDGLVNLRAMVDQLAAKGFPEDKSIPIVLGKVFVVAEQHFANSNAKFQGFLDGALHYSALSITGVALNACLKFL